MSKIDDARKLEKLRALEQSTGVKAETSRSAPGLGAPSGAVERAERASQPEPAKGEPGVRSLCNSSDACVLDDGHKEPCSRIRPTTQGEP